MLQEVTDLELSMGMSKDYEEAIRMVGDFFSFTESTFLLTLSNPSPLAGQHECACGQFHFWCTELPC